MAKESRQVINGKTILLRKGKSAPSVSKAQFSPEQTREIIHDYIYSGESTEQVADRWNTTKQTVAALVRTFQADLNNTTETRELIESQKIDSGVTSTQFKLPHRRVTDAKLINQKFLECLSGPDDLTLTTEEQTYCWIYTYTNNNTKAIKESGLDVGLDKRQSARKDNKQATSYSNAIKLRGYYLRNKDNISRYITSLREEKLQDLKIDKGYIQSQLVTEIEQLNEEADPSRTNSKLRALDLLGKTIAGCFSETIKIEEVSPDKALDQLLEMAKADVKKLPTGHGGAIDASYTTIDN